MAALQKIRSKSTLLIVIIALGLFAFVFPWNEVSSFINRGKDKAFVVDGEVVSTGKYSERIAEWENFQKIMSNRNSLDEATVAQIREGAYQQMVKEIMLDDQAKKLGLAVTREELNDMVYGNTSPILYQIPLFANPETGQFDKARLTQFLTDINNPNPSEAEKPELMAKKRLWAFIENMLKYQRLEEKYSSLVAGTVLVNNTEIKASYDDSKSTANISYVLQKYSSLPDSTVQVSDNEIKALYDQRKNNYKLDSERRKISYFVKDVIPSDEDNAVVEKEINSIREKLAETDNPAVIVNEYSANPYVDAFIAVSSLPADLKNFVQSASTGNIYGPIHQNQSYVIYELVDKTVASDSIKLQTIPLPQGMNQEDNTHLTDSLYNVLKAGKDFTALANEIMPGSNGGEIGWVTEMMLASAGIGKECFAAPKGEVLKLSLGGQTQLFRIADKTAPVAKVKIAAIEIPVFISDKTQNAIDNELNQFLSENISPNDFDKAALAKGYNVVSNILISPADMSLGQVSGSRQVVNWAFNNPTGSIKKFDLSDKRIVAVIKSEIKGEYLPVSEVTPELKAELIINKKAEKIIADLTSKNLTSLTAYADAMGNKIDTVNFITFETRNITGIGYEPLLNAVAKAAPINKINNPAKGRNGVLVTDVTVRTDDPKTYDPKQLKQSMRQNNYYQIVSQSIIALKDKMKVKDNRTIMF